MLAQREGPRVGTPGAEKRTSPRTRMAHRSAVDQTPLDHRRVRELGFKITPRGWVPLSPEVVQRLDEAEERRRATPWRDPLRTVPGDMQPCYACGGPAEPSLVNTPTCCEICTAVLWAWTGEGIAETITSAGEIPQAPWPEKERRPVPRVEGKASVERAAERVGTCTEVLERHGVIVRGHKALCVFHNEHTPSLSLFTRGDKSRFRCHGCDAHGDAIDLEAHLAGESVAETIRRWGR